MPDVTLTCIIKIKPGMRITRLRVNSTILDRDKIPEPVNNTVKATITFFVGMEDFFSFSMDGVGDTSNVKGTYNFDFDGTSVMKEDAEFIVKRGLIKEFKDKIMFP